MSSSEWKYNCDFMKSFFSVLLTCCVFLLSGCMDPADKNDANGNNMEYHEYVESLLDDVEDWDVIVSEISEIVEILEDELTRMPAGSEESESLKSNIEEIKERLSDVLMYKSEILKVSAQILLESDSKLAAYAIKDIEANLKGMVDEIQAIGEILGSIALNLDNKTLNQIISDIRDMIGDTAAPDNPDNPDGEDNEGSEDDGQVSAGLRHVRKITIDDGWYGAQRVIEFEYDSEGRLISSEILDEEGITYTCDYDYSVDGELHLAFNESYAGEDNAEQYDAVLKINENGRAYSMQEEGTEYRFSYSDKGYLTAIEVDDSESVFKYVYDYQDDCMSSLTFQSPWGDDVVDFNGLYGNRYDAGKINIDLNRVFIPLLYSDTPAIVYSFFDLGRMGAYLPERIHTWGGNYNLGTYCPDGTTYDADYTYTVTKTYDEYDPYEDHLYTVPIDTYLFDSDGYPVGFESVVCCTKRKLEVTYGAGEVVGEDENGKIYEVVEKDSKTTDVGSVEFNFSADIEYI